MEDYASIVWIIIIVASLIINVVAKARKQLKKMEQQAGGGEPTKHETHTGPREAWPSWDKEWARDNASEQGPGTERGAISPRPQPARRPEKADTAPFGTERNADASDSFGTAENFSAEHLDAEPMLSLETDEGYAQTVRQREAPPERKNRTQQVATPQQAVADMGGRAFLTEITDEFDLRKAVIYSELLKPKFREEGSRTSPES